MITAILIVSAALIFAFLMGYFIQYARLVATLSAMHAVKRQVDTQDLVRKKKRYSAIWHGLGFIVRALLFAAIWTSLWGDWYFAILFSLVFIIIGWQVFDKIINVIIGNDFWYVDNRNINRFFGKAYYGIAVFLIIVTIYWAAMGLIFFD